ncbi:beta-xylosidase [Streptomyces sp. NPDC090022]|uniref:beta-xylosidase n=1 Tax=Streptomyces sp. NPDC090022 TaxID=3365920 RepID=UPI0037FCE1E6
MATGVRNRRRAAALGLAVLTAAALGVPAAGAEPAAEPPVAGPVAGTPTGPGDAVAVAMRCGPPAEAGAAPVAGTGDGTGDGPVAGTGAVRLTVSDPRPRAGDTVTVTYEVARTVVAGPAAGELMAGTVVLGGAQTGTVTVTGIRGEDPEAGTAAGAEVPPLTMTGMFTVTAPGPVTLTPGDHVLHTTPCTLDDAPVAARLDTTPLPMANLRSVSLAAPSGLPGEKVTVRGVGFVPGAAVTVTGRAGEAPTADRATATADGAGGFTAELAVTDRGTTGIVAHEGTEWAPGRSSGVAAYAVMVPAPVPVPLPVLPPAPAPTAGAGTGTLSMAQTGAQITLGAVANGAGGGAAGRIGTVTVTDTRTGGGRAGWTLTGKVTVFTGRGGKPLQGARLVWRPSCAGCAAGPSGAVGVDGAVLATGPAGGGRATVDATVTLEVPPYTATGAYTAVLTLTLS